MSGNFSPGEAGGLFAAAIAGASAFWAALRWLLVWTDRRALRRDAQLKAWEASLNRREIDERARRERRLQVLERHVAALSGLVLQLTAALRCHDPGNPALAKAEELMRTAFAEADET